MTYKLKNKLRKRWYMLAFLTDVLLNCSHQRYEGVGRSVRRWCWCGFSKFFLSFDLTVCCQIRSPPRSRTAEMNVERKLGKKMPVAFFSGRASQTCFSSFSLASRFSCRPFFAPTVNVSPGDGAIQKILTPKPF